MFRVIRPKGRPNGWTPRGRTGYFVTVLPAVENVDLTELVKVLRRALWEPEGEAAAEPDPNRPQIVVQGTDEAGLVVVSIFAGETEYRLKVPELGALFALAGPPLKPRRELSAERLPYVSRTGPKLPVVQETATVDPLSIILAGESAQNVPGIITVDGEKFRGAAYTCRGPTKQAQGIEYKPFNEDAVVVRFRRADPAQGLPEIAGIGVFDQAGGEGQVADRHGAASEVVAKSFDEALAAIEGGEEPQHALRSAILLANDQVQSLGVGAITTFAGAVVVAQGDAYDAYVAIAGDSRALLFDKNGKLREKTALHNLGVAVSRGEVDDLPPIMALRFAGVLTRSIGGMPELPDLYTWRLEPGDRLVLESDGIGDAHELEEMPQGLWHADHCAEQQGKVVSTAKAAPDCAASLVGYALDQMAEGYGKPDNVSVAVIEVL
jgi:serine/threonine protein phosphatase PrpC